MVYLNSMGLEELELFVMQLGLKRYRYLQVRNWLYKQHVTSWDEMTNLPQADRVLLAGKSRIGTIEPEKQVSSKDGVTKYLFRLSDGCRIESVLIPEPRRTTICVSTQAGCRQGCRFCVTAARGLERNLETYEILGQIQSVARLRPETEITNVVFMGMGEPMDNLLNFSTAVGIVCDDRGMSFSPRKVTVSTSGLVPQFLEFARQYPKVSMAISLNAPNNDIREQLMPVNRKFPIENLIGAIRDMPLPRRKRVTIEYILIKEVNDTVSNAEELLKLMAGLPVKINLILLNKGAAGNYEPPDMERAVRFQNILLGGKINTTIRKSRGADIMAACGQLASADG